MAYTNRKNNVFECGGQRFALEFGEPHFSFKYGAQRAALVAVWRIFGKAGQ